MTIRVELNPETEARLVAEARSQGVPLEKLAERLLKQALIAHEPHGRGRQKQEKAVSDRQAASEHDDEHRSSPPIERPILHLPQRQSHHGRSHDEIRRR